MSGAPLADSPKKGEAVSYEREHIAIIEPPYVWGALWQRPFCGCFLVGGAWMESGQ